MPRRPLGQVGVKRQAHVPSVRRKVVSSLDATAADARRGLHPPLDVLVRFAPSHGEYVPPVRHLDAMILSRPGKYLDVALEAGARVDCAARLGGARRRTVSIVAVVVVAVRQLDVRLLRAMGDVAAFGSVPGAHQPPQEGLAGTIVPAVEFVFAGRLAPRGRGERSEDVAVTRRLNCDDAVCGRADLGEKGLNRCSIPNQRILEQVIVPSQCTWQPHPQRIHQRRCQDTVVISVYLPRRAQYGEGHLSRDKGSDRRLQRIGVGLVTCPA
mmetsp:Transcript_26108/g.77269  ORF Transcript_26108/g.77269 Transcript_26108/m.77269 type:complete len:269 (+) Transcript_26108:681-1487(+)